MMNLKKTLSFVLALCAISMAFIALGCQKSSEDVIRESIVARFEPYRLMDENIVSRLAKTAEDEGLPDMGISGTDFAYAVLDGFSYSIGKIDVSDKKATAQVSISSKSITDLSAQLEAIESKFDKLGIQGASQKYKTEQIREMVMQAIKDTAISEEPITLHFYLDGTEWTSNNATEELDNLDSIVFSG